MKIQMNTGWSKIATLMATIALCIFIGLTRFGVSTPQAQSPNMTKVLIAFNIQPGPPEEVLVRGVGGEIKYTYHLVPAIAATVPAQAMQGLRRNPNVTAVELDLEVHAIDAELENTWGVEAIGAGTVHNSGNKGGGVKVAILDTGIDTDHPELRFKYDPNCSVSFVNGQEIEDGHSHGTHVAGTIAASDDNAGVVGVAPDVTLCIYKVLSNSGSGSYSDVIAALQQAVDDDVQITNNSYGSSFNPGTTVKAAFDNAYAAGVLHIAAAGNSGNAAGTGENCIYPARWASVVATAATTINGTRASFSSTCPDVELAAPGSQINSTVPGGGYGLKSGTSMASPHAAGVAALVWAANPGWNKVNIRNQLQDTVDDLGDLGRDPHYGFGLVNAVQAVGGGGSAPGNNPPQADDQSLTVAQGSSVAITLTGSDPDQDPLTFSLVSNPENGTLEGTPPNLTYTPTALNANEDSFMFKVNDGQVDSEPATVFLTITPESPGIIPDTVVITKANYRSRQNRLDVEATSSAGGAETLTATVGEGGSQRSVDLSYNSRKNKHTGSISGLSSKPSGVTVSSTGGGSDSLDRSDIGGKG